MALEAIIFDVDGTLAEVEELHRRAFNEAFAASGADAAYPDPQRHWLWDAALYRELMAAGGGEARIAAYVRDWLGRDPDPRRVAALNEAKVARCAAILAEDGIALRPGIGQLLVDAKANGIRRAVATSMDAADLDAVCRAAFGAPPGEVFDAAAAGDEVAKLKPAPDVYLRAIEGLGLPAAACVALEDSRNGLRAAHAAGLRCVVSPSVHTAGDDLSGADVLVRGFDEVASVEALVQALAHTGGA